jgi:light-regulated signal transduction histidine kinase (bacteriophytochrome)
MTPDQCQRMLDELNREMDLMLYAISHDLRAPLRAIDGFSQAVIEDHAADLGDSGRDSLERVRSNGMKINRYINALLEMSRESRSDIIPEAVNLSTLAEEVNAALAETYPGHSPELTVEQDVTIVMDRLLARTLLTKLLDNAWKFTAASDDPRITFGTEEHDGKQYCFIRDNGAGFDMHYAKDILFGVFQRMHGEDEYPGLGTGLATARRIVNRHHGDILAEAETGRGCTIFFRVNDDQRRANGHTDPRLDH